MPEFAQTTEFTCLAPIIAAVAREDRTTAYLRPTDPEFSEAVRANLLWKHRVLYNADPEDCSLAMEFSPRYLADPRTRGGTKLVNFKGISMVGAMAPFRLTGSKELMRVGYECGFGGKNGIGCGMAEVREEGRGKSRC
jgi:CRISPR-associated endoribonuclease Cas6